MKNSIIILCLLLSANFSLAQQNLAKYAKLSADSYSSSHKPEKANDGKISDNSRWVSNAALESHWLLFEFKAKQNIKTVDIYSGYKNSSVVENFEFQIEKNGTWTTIEGSTVSDNDKNEVRITFPKVVVTDKIRFFTPSAGGNGQARIRDIQMWPETSNQLPELTKLKFAKEDPKRNNPKFDRTKHLIFLNQTGFNTFWPKRFTAPISPDGSVFHITPSNSDKVLFSGKVKNHIGDFSIFRMNTDTYEYVIRMEGNGLKNGQSVPFSIKPFLFEETTYELAVRHFIDNRSVTGTHPGAYGAVPWRDAPFYAYTVPSLVNMYLANPDFCKQLPVEMNWKHDMQRVLADDFKFEAGAGENSMEVVADMYNKLDGPIGDNVPDVIQLIHWGVSWWYIKPASKDYAGSEYKIHPETISEFAFFLYAYPHMKQYFTKKYHKTIHDYTFKMWEKVGLLKVDKTIGTFKGRYTPGWTILPNLMMYEVAKREGRKDAEKYIQAADAQVKWIIDELNINDPLVTRGQRMSEHKMTSGLYVYFANYSHRLPSGFSGKIQKLADVFIERSDNMWDFRRYDLKENWSLPRKLKGHTGGGTSWNSPGNLAAFPSIAWKLNKMLGNSPEDNKRKERLNILAVSQLDNLFGRNPLGYHTALRAVKDFKGAEAGWPVKYNPNVCARLHLVRGTICSAASSEHYPFNPDGKFRHPEGWTAFNAALNMGLIAATEKNIQIEADAVYDGLKIKLAAPVFGTTAHLLLETSSGDSEIIELHAKHHSNTLFYAKIKTESSKVVTNDGNLQLKTGDKLTVSFGNGFFKTSKTISLEK